MVLSPGAAIFTDVHVGQFDWYAVRLRDLRLGCQLYFDSEHRPRKCLGLAVHRQHVTNAGTHEEVPLGESADVALKHL